MTEARRPPDRSAGCPAETSATIERLRRQRWTGPRIARALGRPVSTVGAVLRRLGLGRLSALEAKPPAVRYDAARRASCSSWTARSWARSTASVTASPETGAATGRAGSAGVPARRDRRYLATRLHRAAVRRARSDLRRLPCRRCRLVRQRQAYASSADRAIDPPPWLHWYNHHRRPDAGIRALTQQQG
jgi:hypothetical protein